MQNAEDQLKVLKAVAHPVRLQILKLLRSGECCVQEANNTIKKISQPNLSQHMNLLKKAGLIDCRIEGKKRCYFLSRPTLVLNLLDLLELEHEYMPCEKVQQLLNGYESE